MTTDINGQTVPENWVRDCLFWRDRVLVGRYRHWCVDWDGLPVDETTIEWEVCSCFPGVRQV